MVGPDGILLEVGSSLFFQFVSNVLFVGIDVFIGLNQYFVASDIGNGNGSGNGSMGGCNGKPSFVKEPLMNADPTGGKSLLCSSVFA